jgi:signal transduction histidine kinase
MGIGSYESSQYIREIGGGLNVDSEPGRGTVITVLLPLLDVGLPQRSDLYSSAK